MKKTILLLAIAFTAGNFVTSCGSRDDEPATQPEVQDFTNAKFIKTTLQGDWKEVSYSYDGISYTSETVATYKFVGDSYTYVPYDTSSSLNESGTYVITPVISNNNAFLKMDYTYNNNPRNKTLTLLDYSGGIVTIVQNYAISPTGKYYQKFKKQ